MFTIKAIGPEGQTRIYEAIEISISPNRRQLDFIRPTSPDLTECLLINSNSGVDFSLIFIENQSGKTIESLRS